MARGGVQKPIVHYKGASDDFFVYIDSQDDYEKWKTDKTVALAQVVSAFKVFETNKYVISRLITLSYGGCSLRFFYRHGAQGTYNEPSHAALDNEFGTHNEEEVIKIILEKGTIQESSVSCHAFRYQPRQLLTWALCSSLNVMVPATTPTASSSRPATSVIELRNE